MPKREKTIEALYRLHYDDLLRRACILLHDEEDARDAVSDVMARLMAADILPESDLTQARYEYLYQQALLQFYRGEPLQLVATGL